MNYKRGDEQIRRAIEAGQFDNLPGKGKPLDLNENPFEDPEWHMANKILKDAGFAPAWIEASKEIDAQLELGRAELRRAYQRRLAGQDAHQPLRKIEAGWQQAEETFRTMIAEVNQMIFDYNLKAPMLQVQRLQIDASKEIQALLHPGGNKPA